jgi:hypothetical protein
MRPIQTVLLASLLALPSWVLAQQAPPIEQAMAADDFRAAGLHKLSAEELARLNLWLDRRVQEQSSAAIAAATDRAREEGRKELVAQSRGFFHFGSNEPIEASIAGEFRGFGRHNVYVLDNGQEWKQVDGATLASVKRSNPKVRIKPAAFGNVWYLQIEGYNTSAKVERIK